MARDRTPSQRGKFSRSKGPGFERDVVKALRPVFGSDVKRGLQSREGAEQCDCEGTPYWVECKRGRKVNWRPALKQAQADSDGRTPVVVLREDREDAVVVMRFDDWLSLHTEMREFIETITKAASDDPNFNPWNVTPKGAR